LQQFAATREQLDNSPNVGLESTKLNVQALARKLIRYREPNGAWSTFELCVTAGALVFSWVLMWLSLSVGYWLTLLLAVPTAGFLVRLFMIQHDCGHGSFFRWKLANDWIGRALGVLTFTPYDYWKRNHAVHHATSGNLDRRGIGDILTLTVDEYFSRSRLGRFAYRVYRNPLVLFGVGPAYLFFLQHRLPVEQMRGGWRPWVSAFATNAAIAAGAGLMIWLIGPWSFFAVHVPVMLLAASIGVWLFYVQHQYESVMWARGDGWAMQDAALAGSSHYDLPAILRWFTANIGVHHVHHLCSRIPFYRLRQVLRDNPELRNMGRVTFGQSVLTVRLALWDETRHKLISFREATRLRRKVAAL
jgi:omega-6 fatty acid desaturase (delta-12 desaturase)